MEVIPEIKHCPYYLRSFWQGNLLCHGFSFEDNIFYLKESKTFIDFRIVSFESSKFNFKWSDYPDWFKELYAKLYKHVLNRFSIRASISSDFKFLNLYVRSYVYARCLLDGIFPDNVLIPTLNEYELGKVKAYISELNDEHGLNAFAEPYMKDKYHIGIRKVK